MFLFVSYLLASSCHNPACLTPTSKKSAWSQILKSATRNPGSKLRKYGGRKTYRKKIVWTNPTLARKSAPRDHRRSRNILLPPRKTSSRAAQAGEYLNIKLHRFLAVIINALCQREHARKVPIFRRTITLILSTFKTIHEKWAWECSKNPRFFYPFSIYSTI